MINVTDENRTDITTVYCHRLLNDMDWDTLYSFAYYMLRDNKDHYTNKDLEKEIINYCPDILEEQYNEAS